jgi:ketosteroid isomerase-like protein
MVAKGRDAIRASYEKFFSANTVSDVRLDYDYSSTSGNLSVASGRYSFTAHPKAGGAAQNVTGRFTSVAARKSGKWMYVSDHASGPLPPPPAATAR